MDRRRPGERRDPYRGTYLRHSVCNDLGERWHPGVMGPGFRRDDQRVRANWSPKTRNGAADSAVLVHQTRGIGPLRLALAGATRSGAAGVGTLLAIQPKGYASANGSQHHSRWARVAKLSGTRMPLGRHPGLSLSLTSSARPARPRSGAVSIGLRSAHRSRRSGSSGGPVRYRHSGECAHSRRTPRPWSG